MLLGKDFHIEKVDHFLRLCEFTTFLGALSVSSETSPLRGRESPTKEEDHSVVVGGSFNHSKRKGHSKLVLGRQDAWIPTHALQILKVHKDVLN